MNPGAPNPAGSLLVVRDPFMANQVLGPNATSMALTGTVAAGQLVGALAKRTGKPLAGSVSAAKLVGTLTKRTGKILVGGVAANKLVGAVVRKTGKVFAGLVHPGPGTVARSTARRLAGAVLPGGAVLRRISKRFAGALLPSGLVATYRQPGGPITLRSLASRSYFSRVAGDFGDEIILDLADVGRGVPLNIAGATAVNLQAMREGYSDVLWSRSMTVLDAANGVVRYVPTPSDFPLPGLLRLRVQVVFPAETLTVDAGYVFVEAQIA